VRLNGRVTLITGSSRGLGREIAISFAREGSDIALNFRSNSSAMESTIAEIRALGRRVIAVQADVTSRISVAAMFREVIDEFGRIDVLVNNAGINQRCLFHEISDEDWDNVLSVNLRAPFVCCQEVFPIMIKQGGGRIINISSVASQYHGPKTVHYAVSKAGLNSLTRVLARYGAEHGILVNAVAPGIIMTDQTRSEFESGDADVVIGMTLLKRPGIPRDVSEACIYLADHSHSYMTGQILAVSGGAYLG